MPSAEEVRLASRLRRLEAVDPLLSTLATALDVREVFAQVARVAREALPHDLLVLGRFGENMDSASAYAFSEGIASEPDTVRWSPRMRELFARDSLITRDLEDHPDPQTARFLARSEDRWVEGEIDATMKRTLLRYGIRSTLNAAVRIRGVTVGGLLFLSRARSAYDDEDAWVACRIADLVALALAHEQLAEEARQAAAAREQAQRLEVRVARLTEELAASGGPHRQVGVSRKWRDVLA